MEKITIGIYRFFAKNRAIFYTVFVFTLLFISYFASKVKFEEDISKIIPKDKATNKVNEIFQNSKFIDRLVIMISLKDTTAENADSLVAFADKFGEVAQGKLGRYIKNANFKVSDEAVLDLFDIISSHLPIYLDDKDYLAIDSLITPSRVKESLEYDLSTLSSPAGIALKKIISQDPTGISMLGIKKLQQLQYDKSFELYDSYVVTKDHKNLMLFITPVYPPNNTGENAPFLKGLDSIFNQLGSKDFTNINAAYFGAVAGFSSNATQLRQDTNLTVTTTIIAFTVFFIFYFRKKRAPLIILVPALFGGLFSLACIYFIKGSLSVIAMGTGSLIVGVAVNYSLHVFNHYKHTKNVEEVIKDLTQPLTIGSFTSIGGFFCLEFVQSDMLRDLGLFAGFSLIGASLCSLIFLPHFITSKKVEKQHNTALFSWIDKLASYKLEYNKYVIIVILALTVVFVYTANNVRFEFDLSGMNYLAPKLKQAEAKLNKINKFALQSIYLVTEGKTLDEALANNEKQASKIQALADKNVVIKYSQVSSLIISRSLQQQRIAKWNKYWTPEKKQQLLTTLRQQGVAMGFRPSAFDNFQELLNKNFDTTTKADLDAITSSFFGDFITEKPGHSTVVTLVQTSPQNKPKVYDAFKNEADVTVIDKQYLANKLAVVINADFGKIAIMASLLVFTVLLLTYGRIELTMVSFIPMAISWVWVLGIMGIFGIEFNIVNIIVSALIFGLGDDYSLYIMDGLLQQYKTGKKLLVSYKTSIFLSAFATIIGLGVLIFAKHPALKSIAFISITGIFCVVIMSQILIPFFFNIIIRNRAAKKRFPWTLRGFLISIFAFLYFIAGCILLTILGLLFKLNPFNKEKGKYVYHVMISKFTWSLMYIMVNVKKKVINPQGEDFSKPAVVISNHQSFLDILSIIMLHPKLILFTNNWVWNSPVFGAVVRMADYYPVAHGAENSIELLADRVKQGYSIAIFPEGTRSVDGDMKRFHKGAFFLAEQLNIDILPVVLHGTGYTMTKGDFLLKDGTITIKYLPRITPGNEQFGTGYAKRTSQVSRYFKEEFKKLRTEIEGPAYYKEQLMYNYLYKSPTLEWHIRLKLMREKNYQLFNNLLPASGKILHAGCSYGSVAYLLHFVSKEREISGIDTNEDKIEVANNCFSKDDKINFTLANVLQYTFEAYDAILVTGVLPNLQKDEQLAVLENSIKALNPGGTLVISVTEKELAGALQSFTQLVKDAAITQNMQCEVVNQTNNIPYIVFVIKHRPISNGAL